jgi:hypothetical protein
MILIYIIINSLTSCNKNKINEELIGNWRLDSIMPISSKVGMQDTVIGYTVVQFKEDKTLNISSIGIIAGTYELKKKNKITAIVEHKATSGYIIPHWQNVLIDLLNNAVRYDINDDQLTIYKSDNWIGKLSRL